METLSKAATLSDELAPYAATWDRLYARFASAIKLVEEMLGVAPNSFIYSAIWEPGFVSENLIVPSMLNLPKSLIFDHRVFAWMGQAIYHSSKAADCPYCTAHGCLFAMRRGSAEADFVQPTAEKEDLIRQVAEGLSTVPASLSPAVKTQFEAAFSKSEAYWIVSAVAMMGYLNKVMDSMGTPLEADALQVTQRVLKDEAWDAGKHLTEAAAAEEVDEAAATRKDSLTTIFRVMRLAPQAIRLESGWTQGVPKGLTRVQDHLKQQLGYDFPILRHIASGRQLRSLAAVLLHNLKPEGSTTGVAVKPLAGLVYANTVFSPHVKAIATGLLPLGGDPSAEVVEAMEALGYGEIPTPERYAEQIRDLAALPGLGEVEASLLLFAKTISPSPTEVPAELIGLLMEKLSPEQIIEMVTWVGILGLLHRLGAYYEQ